MFSNHFIKVLFIFLVIIALGLLSLYFTGEPETVSFIKSAFAK
ncbi:MAG: hypothetical protein NTW62_00570 [Candidatus Nomurabacteria bacterium]|nr:hypothetical protein [Candidatus Nomurabacteria bacterium]